MYDIIIIGGGPAGAVAGKYLAQSGKKILLIQKNFSFKKPCGGGLRMDAFEEFDIDKSLIKNLITEMSLETTKRKIDFDLTHLPLTIVDRVEFDQALRQDAHNAGATLLEGKMLNVSVKENSVEVEVKVKDEVKVYESEYLIASDGVLSQVRKQLKGEYPPHRLTHYSDVEKFSSSKCHFYFGSTLAPDVYAWRFPYGDGSDVGVLATGSGKHYIHNLFKFLGISTQERVEGYNIPEWEKPIFYENRVFYVGDAGGQVLPFTYEGIYYAMKSAKILSETIIEGQDPSQYEVRWNKLYLKKFTVLKRLQKLFLKNDFMINIMMRIMEKPEIKNKVLALWMDRYELKLDGAFLYKCIKKVF